MRRWKDPKSKANSSTSLEQAWHSSHRDQGAEGFPTLLQELFMADARILTTMVSEPEVAELVADDIAVVKQILAVSQLVARKLQSEKRYLARLEGRRCFHMPG